MHKFLGYLFLLQLVLAGTFAYLQVEFEHDRGLKMSYLMLDSTGGLKQLPYNLALFFPQIVYAINVGRWLLTFMTLMPISLVVTLNLAKFI